LEANPRPPPLASIDSHLANDGKSKGIMDWVLPIMIHRMGMSGPAPKTQPVKSISLPHALDPDFSLKKDLPHNASLFILRFNIIAGRE